MMSKQKKANDGSMSFNYSRYFLDLLSSWDKKWIKHKAYRVLPCNLFPSMWLKKKKKKAKYKDDRKHRKKSNRILFPKIALQLR